MKILLVSVLTIFCLLGLILIAEGDNYGGGGGWGGGGWGSGYGYGGGLGYLPYYGGYYGGAGGGGGFGNGGFLALIGLIFIILIIFGSGFNNNVPNQTIAVIGG